MAAHNRGIMHLGSKGAGTMPVCRKVNAHMSTDTTSFDAEAAHGRQCLRCAAYRNKQKAIAARKEVGA